MTLQDRTLRHTIALLRKFETHKIYMAVHDSLQEQGIEDKSGKKIRDALNTEMTKQMENVREAIDRLESLNEELK